MFFSFRYCNTPLNTGIVTKEDFTACTVSTVDTDIEITERPSDHKLVVRFTLAVMTVVEWTDYETMLPEHKRHPLILPKHLNSQWEQTTQKWFLFPLCLQWCVLQTLSVILYHFVCPCLKSLCSDCVARLWLYCTFACVYLTFMFHFGLFELFCVSLGSFCLLLQMFLSQFGTCCISSLVGVCFIFISSSTQGLPRPTGPRGLCSSGF